MGSATGRPAGEPTCLANHVLRGSMKELGTGRTILPNAVAKPSIQDIRTAITKAAAKTGTDFHFLLANATAESSLRPHAKSTKSSAAGLHQFTQSTWLALIRDYGAKSGLKHFAAAIQTNRDGSVNVADPTLKHQILALRQNPELSATMAGEYARQNSRYLEGRLGRAINSTDLYAAHLFGPAGAVRFLKALETDPTAPAAGILPGAARANKSVFYMDGRAKSVGEIQDWLQQRMPEKTGPKLAQKSKNPAPNPPT